MPDDDRDLLQRVIEELESEGEDFRHLGYKTAEALKQLAIRIARRLNELVERVLDALERIADRFS